MQQRIMGLIIAVVVALGVVSPVSATTFPGDNGSIAAVRSGSLVVVDSDGVEHAVTRGGSSQPTWSPDGTKLAFVKNGNVYIAKDGRSRAITHGRGFTDNAPVWSADGSQLAFVRFKHGRSGVMSVRPNGTQLRMVSGWSRDTAYRSPSWSPDGSQIVYEAMSSTGSKLVIKDIAINAVRDLTELSDVTESAQAVWSPSGSKILYRDSATELYTIRPDGSRRATIADGDSYNGAWSPDGERIAFIEDASDGYVSVTDPDGTVNWLPIDLTGYDRVVRVQWSPDGARLLLTLQRDDRYDIASYGLADAAQQLRVVDVMPGVSWQAR